MTERAWHTGEWRQSERRKDEWGKNEQRREEWRNSEWRIVEQRPRPWPLFISEMLGEATAWWPAARRLGERECEWACRSPKLWRSRDIRPPEAPRFVPPRLALPPRRLPFVPRRSSRRRRIS